MLRIICQAHIVFIFYGVNVNPANFSQRDIYVNWMMCQEEFPTEAEFDAGMEIYEKQEEEIDFPEISVSPGQESVLNDLKGN